jgi:hypothetical protein
MRKKPAVSVSQMEDLGEEDELFYESESDSSECIIEPERKKPKNPGPTTRSHCGEGSSSKHEDYVPSSEELSEDYVNDLPSDDDDDCFEAMRYTNCSQPLKPGLQMRKNQHQVFILLCNLARISMYLPF